MTIEIVLLAMVALFVGLRLYAVLGRRTGHEQQPVIRPAEGPATAEPVPASADTPAEKSDRSGLVYEDNAANGIRAIIAADGNFDVARFLEGAQAAYRMILEAYWKGDREALADLVGDEVRSSFETAMAEREAAGHMLDNRLVAIERVFIQDAQLAGRTATIIVRYDADIAAVTRNAEGEVIAGSLSDAVETHDVWTFQRTLGSNDPNWVLVETDEG